MNTEQMRKEFERAARELVAGCDFTLHPDIPNYYFWSREQELYELWQAALATQPQAPQGDVTVPRSLALKTWGFLAQDCSPCAHEECQIDGKNIGVDGLATEWFALVKAAPETPEGKK